MRYSRFVRRIAVTGEASVRSCATEDSEDGTLLDVSRKGARLCINRLGKEKGVRNHFEGKKWDRLDFPDFCIHISHAYGVRPSEIHCKYPVGAARYYACLSNRFKNSRLLGPPLDMS